jgi:hypothetical protein
MNNCRILLSPQFRCRFLELASPEPIIGIDNTFHLANISNPVSHACTISEIVELRQAVLFRSYLTQAKRASPVCKPADGLAYGSGLASIEQ